MNDRMHLTFTLDGEAHAVSIAARRPELVVTVDGHAHVVGESATPDPDTLRLEIDGRAYDIIRTWEGDQLHVRCRGRNFTVDYADPVTAAHQQAGGDDVLRADMPGVVVSVDCKAGQQVESGDVLLVTESMKMQVSVVAPRDGTIEAVLVEAGETFDKGAELVKLHEDP